MVSKSFGYNGNPCWKFQARRFILLPIKVEDMTELATWNPYLQTGKIRRANGDGDGPIQGAREVLSIPIVLLQSDISGTGEILLRSLDSRTKFQRTISIFYIPFYPKQKSDFFHLISPPKRL